jgi:cyanophycinase-like exopeptidase
MIRSFTIRATARASLRSRLVTFVDGRTVRFDNAEEVTKGRQLTLSSLRVGIVGTGYTFNLRVRELEALMT